MYAHHTDKQLVALLNNSDENYLTEINNRYLDKLFVVANYPLDKNSIPVFPNTKI